MLWREWFLSRHRQQPKIRCLICSILFNIYTIIHSAKIISSSSLSRYLYADNTPLFISFDPNNFISAVTQLQDTIFYGSLPTYFLSFSHPLNQSKAEIMLFSNKSPKSPTPHSTFSVYCLLLKLYPLRIFASSSTTIHAFLNKSSFLSSAFYTTSEISVVFEKLLI